MIWSVSTNAVKNCYAQQWRGSTVNWMRNGNQLISDNARRLEEETTMAWIDEMGERCSGRFDRQHKPEKCTMRALSHGCGKEARPVVGRTGTKNNSKT
jgi:hypothetical protein